MESLLPVLNFLMAIDSSALLKLAQNLPSHQKEKKRGRIHKLHFVYPGRVIITRIFFKYWLMFYDWNILRDGKLGVTVKKIQVL